MTNDQFIVTLGSGKSITLYTDYKPHAAIFWSHNKTWYAQMLRNSIREAPSVWLTAPQSYPSLSREETDEILNTIFSERGFLSWNDPEAAEFRTP